MEENFNTETKTTAGYSPWSNKLSKRHNQTPTDIINEINNNGCDWHTAQDLRTVSTMFMVVAHLLVFGQNPNQLNVLIDNLPALEDTSVKVRKRQKPEGAHIESMAHHQQ